MDPRYLRGVIDALELVASFLAWKKAHPESSKTVKDFVKEALKKTERRAGRGLDELLGIKLLGEK